MIVLHYTAMTSAQAACRTLCNPENEVSAHYLIAEDGEVMSLVAEEMRAWHGGAGRWGDVIDVNRVDCGHYDPLGYSRTSCDWPFGYVTCAQD